MDQGAIRNVCVGYAWQEMNLALKKFIVVTPEVISSAEYASSEI